MARSQQAGRELLRNLGGRHPGTTRAGQGGGSEKTCLLCQEGWAWTSAPAPKLSREPPPRHPAPVGMAQARSYHPACSFLPGPGDFLTGYSPKDKQILSSK